MAGPRRLLRRWVRVHHPVTAALKARSEADRFARDYADKMVLLSRAADGRLHPRVGVLAARTGRMAYAEPPVQQLPPRVRRMLRFDAPATSMDWASIEPVFFANIVGEERLLRTFEAGGDVYLPVAELAGVSRPVAKTIVLAQLYGQGATALAGQARARRGGSGPGGRPGALGDAGDAGRDRPRYAGSPTRSARCRPCPGGSSRSTRTPAAGIAGTTATRA